jgi:2-phospho-L-lactate guanylyltransferase
MTARVRVVVPIKPLAASKSRLAPRLPEDRRSRLVIAMLGHVLQAVRRAAAIAQVSVLGGDDTVRTTCHRLQVPWEPDPASSLNRCLQIAFRSGQRDGWSATVFVPADLPELRPDDIARLVALSRGARQLVIAPDRFETGTNALLVPSAIAFRPMLGTHSFRKHLAQARSLRLPIAVCHSEGLLLDVDTPSDLDVLLQRRPGWWQEVDQAIHRLALPAELVGWLLRTGTA